MTHTILHIDASARIDASVSRTLSSEVVTKLGGTVIRRDLNDALPQITEHWVEAKTAPADTRTQSQNDALALSDELVNELQAADTIVIGLPIYNFGIPASLKAWIDLIARPGMTFKYTENGPVGLLQNKRAILVAASGGTPVGSAIDFATPYMQHVLGFVGIDQVEIIAADRLGSQSDAAIETARAKLASLAA
ncbi:MAG: NAD(P)H-dependent oxidoreductase [Paracoccaceae bacterium]